MNFKKRVYQWKISEILKKRYSDDFLSLPIGTAGEKLNSYRVIIFRNSRPFLLIDSIADSSFTGRKWNDESKSFLEEFTLSVDEAITDNINIEYFYKTHRFLYRNLWKCIISDISKWPQAKVFFSSHYEKLEQYFFNKKKLITKDRLGLLKFMLSDQLDRTHDSSIDIDDLMGKLYSFRYFYHPDGGKEEQKVRLHLQSLVESEDIGRTSDDKYVVKGKALCTIANYEEEERKHRETVIIQRIIAFLTIIIALAAVAQTGVIKLPVYYDFTKETAEAINDKK
jgi:hypothetical protein